VSVHPTMKRRLHERLHPLIGEEEADALLDELSPADPVTREWLEDRFERLVTKEHLDERLDRYATREQLGERLDGALRPHVTKDHLDTKLEGLDHKMEGMEHGIMGATHEALAQQTHRVYAAAGVFALIISIVDRVWG